MHGLCMACDTPADRQGIVHGRLSPKALIIDAGHLGGVGLGF